jgi:hypothetical protein
MSRRRPKNNANGEWKAQKPMRDELSDATDEDGKDEDGDADPSDDRHVVVVVRCSYGVLLVVLSLVSLFCLSNSQGKLSLKYMFWRFIGDLCSRSTNHLLFMQPLFCN